MSGFDEAPLLARLQPDPDPRRPQRAESSTTRKSDASRVEDHRLGHRDRLRKRFLGAKAEGLAPYELLELILFRAKPRQDMKPLAKALLKRFGSFAEVLTATPDRLREVEGVGDAIVVELKIIEAAAQQLLKGTLVARPLLGSHASVIDYCRAKQAFIEREEFRVLFLDKRNMLVGDEVLGTGTVDHTPAYPREIIKRALELGATALILVHNHPSGDPSPSQADVAMTKHVVALSKGMGIEVHDHFIVGRNGYESLRKLKLM